MSPDLFGWLRGRRATKPPQEHSLDVRSKPSPDVGPQTDKHSLHPQKGQPEDALHARARELVEQYVTDWQPSTQPGWDLRPADYASGRAILEGEPLLQIACIHAALPRLMRSPQLVRLDNRYIAPDLAKLQPLLRQLFLRQLPYTQSDLERILAVLADSRTAWAGFVSLHSFLRHVERQAPENELTSVMREKLERLREAGARTASTESGRKALGLIEKLLGLSQDVGAGIVADDDWGCAAHEALDQVKDSERANWMAILEHARSAEASKPPKVWLEEARRRIDAMGRELFKEKVIVWLGYLNLPSRNTRYQDGDNKYRDANGQVPSVLISATNAQLLKGLIWCCGAYGDDEALAQAVGRAAEACYKKVPWHGARSPKAGNACVQALSIMSGQHSVAQLLRLRLRVKYPSALKLVESAFEAAAVRQHMSPEDLEDLAVPGYGLEEGCLRWEMGRYCAEATVLGVGNVELHWVKPDGSSQRSEPAEVKHESAGELKELKRTVADLRTMLLAQRDRIEALLRTGRSWTYPVWRERYLDHPLLSLLTRRLIWIFEAAGRQEAGAWHNGELQDVQGRVLDWLTDATCVRLWHPLGIDPDEVLAWQLWLEERKVTQPFKQAHREIYTLTEAERTTELYSNRFAAHILRQHQFHALCRDRGWSYQLQGGFDSANTPVLALPQWGLQAEFWVEGAGYNEESRSAANIYLHVATDQVRFASLATHETVSLAQVPPLVFSETLRDVDLFVSVCSIGNDPNWIDRGPEGHRAYWHEYAFGELSVAAQTRRAILERILPHLKIADRCTLSGRFLVVRGDLRIYNIHLGSGNIQMQPNNQYLCIVAAPGTGEGGREGRVYLPFEGDSTLAVILSKAFLLANDRAIKDPTITRQILRK